jgi:hypothetical protein
VVCLDQLLHFDMIVPQENGGKFLLRACQQRQRNFWSKCS